MRAFFICMLGLGLIGCARTEATRTSANTMLIDTGAAPACGPGGAARVASLSAAVETIRAGFDRYVIVGAASQDNVRVTQLPGQYQTQGTLLYGGGVGTIRSTTTYSPGATVFSGRHDRSLQVIMFRNGDPGSQNALDARQMLGAEWQERVRNGIRTCL